MLRETCYIGCLSPKPTRQSVGFAAGRCRVELSNHWIMDLSIVIPVRNEAPNIAPLVAEIRAALDGMTPITRSSMSMTAAATEPPAEIMRLAGRPPRLRAAAPRAELRAERGDPHRRQGGARDVDRDARRRRPERPRRHSARCGDRPRGAGGPAAAGRRPPRQAARQPGRSELPRGSPTRCAPRLLGDATPDTGCGLKLFPRAALSRPALLRPHAPLPAGAGAARGRNRAVGRRSTTGRARAASRITASSTGSGVGIVDLFGVMWLQRRVVRPQTTAEATVDGAAEVPVAPRSQPALSMSGKSAAAIGRPLPVGDGRAARRGGAGRGWDRRRLALARRCSTRKRSARRSPAIRRRRWCSSPSMSRRACSSCRAPCWRSPPG